MTLYKRTINVELPDRVLMLSISNQALAESETPDQQSFTDILNHIMECVKTNKTPLIKPLRALVWGMTREHHSDLTLDDCTSLIMSKDVDVTTALAEAVGEMFKIALPDGEPVPGKRVTSASTRRSPGTGKKPLASTTKPAGPQTISGKKPRAQR